MSEETAKGEFTASSGITIKLRPVSPILIDKVRQSVKMPHPPEYTATTAAGTIETHPHDAESIKTASPEDQLAWVKYQAETLAALAEVNERVTRLILLRGVETGTPEYGWDRAQEELGVKVPSDPNDRKIHYILTEVVATPDDIAGIMTGVMEMVGVKPEDVEAARKSFQHSIHRNTTS